MSNSELIFNWVSANDIQDAHNIEVSSYPPDEAGSLEAFRYRQHNAPHLFMGAYLPVPRTLIAYICSTLSPSGSLTHDSMSTHVDSPNSTSVCIHSVCVAPAHRRKAVGVRLLRHYISNLETARLTLGVPYKRILLITHDELIPFYEKAGFDLIGKSSIVHGSRPWYEMRKVLLRSDSVPPPPPSLPLAQAQEPQPQQFPPGLWEALQRAPRSRPSARLLSSFPNGITDVIDAAPTSTSTSASPTPTNKHDLLCPRDGCGSVILKRGVASWVERASVQMEPASLGRNPLLPLLPPPPETTQWWLVTPSPMTFENIGFSRPVASSLDSATSASLHQPKLKLLACAECDLGPLGWCHEGGTEFWLACARVAYREQTQI